jgi:NADH-quinone oxidoreductase subunit J
MVQMRAYFIAAVQVLVYAGAVIVLFLFIIMLMDLRAEAVRRRNAAGVFAGLVLCFFLGIAGWRAMGPLAGGGGVPPAPGDEAQQIGRLLFADYVLPLQVTGVLLLVAMVGAVVLSRPGGAGGERGQP